MNLDSLSARRLMRRAVHDLLYSQPKRRLVDGAAP